MEWDLFLNFCFYYFKIILRHGLFQNSINLTVHSIVMHRYLIFEKADSSTPCTPKWAANSDEAFSAPETPLFEPLH